LGWRLDGGGSGGLLDLIRQAAAQDDDEREYEDGFHVKLWDSAINTAFWAFFLRATACYSALFYRGVDEPKVSRLQDGLGPGAYGVEP